MYDWERLYFFSDISPSPANLAPSRELLVDRSRPPGPARPEGRGSDRVGSRFERCSVRRVVAGVSGQPHGRESSPLKTRRANFAPERSQRMCQVRVRSPSNPLGHYRGRIGKAVRRLTRSTPLARGGDCSARRCGSIMRERFDGPPLPRHSSRPPSRRPKDLVQARQRSPAPSGTGRRHDAPSQGVVPYMAVQMVARGRAAAVRDTRRARA